MSKHLVLSMDGGGIRGVFIARVLERIEERVPGFLQRVNLFSGTSTGGIIALGLARGFRPAQLRGLYEQKGPMIFAKPSIWAKVKSLFGLTGPLYDNAGLVEALTQAFGPYTLLSDLRARVLVPTFNMNTDDGRMAPKFFHNYPGIDDDGSERVVDVALRTSAAPVYFPSYQNFVDGGLVANNPVMTALAQSLTSTGANRKLEDIYILSIGTGANLKGEKGPARRMWGVTQWAKKLLSITLDGVTDVAHYEAKHILGDRYIRVDTALPVPMDDLASIPTLVQKADSIDIEPVVAWLQQFDENRKVA